MEEGCSGAHRTGVSLTPGKEMGNELGDGDVNVPELENPCILCLWGLSYPDLAVS